MRAEVRKHLDVLESTTVRFRERMDEAMESYIALVQCYEAGTEEEREDIQERIDQSIGRKLIAFSYRCAERAIDSTDRKWIEIGAAAYILEGFRADYRENFRMMVVLDHAAKRIGYSLREAFLRYAGVASRHASERIDEFLSRDPKLNDLQVFGLREKSSPKGTIIST